MKNITTRGELIKQLTQDVLAANRGLLSVEDIVVALSCVAATVSAKGRGETCADGIAVGEMVAHILLPRPRE